MGSANNYVAGYCLCADVADYPLIGYDLSKWHAKTSCPLPENTLKFTHLSEDAASSAVIAQRLKQCHSQISSLLQEVSATSLVKVAIGVLDDERSLVRLVKIRGALLRTMGFVENGVSFLRAEEAVHLVSLGQLRVYRDEEAALEDSAPPLSLRQCFTLLLCKDSANSPCRMESYLVYSFLMRAGYIVRPSRVIPPPTAPVDSRTNECPKVSLVFSGREIFRVSEDLLKQMGPQLQLDTHNNADIGWHESESGEIMTYLQSGLATCPARDNNHLSASLYNVFEPSAKFKKSESDAAAEYVLLPILKAEDSVPVLCSLSNASSSLLCMNDEGDLSFIRVSPADTYLPNINISFPLIVPSRNNVS